jgi:hypothetical protein
LKKETDPQALAQKAWLDLDGVTDTWVQSLQMEQLAGGLPPKRTSAEFAALSASDLCCSQGACLGCCGGAGEPRLILTDEWARVRPVPLILAHEPDERNHLEGP